MALLLALLLFTATGLEKFDNPVQPPVIQLPIVTTFRRLPTWREIQVALFGEPVFKIRYLHTDPLPAYPATETFR